MSSEASSVCFHLLFLLLVSGTAVSHWIVKTLPGFPGELPFKLEIGYALLVSAVKTMYLNLFSKDFIENSYHEGFGKWVEVGNSGMFRPEMLLPMGLPEDVRVIAWGLSLERPTMILYGYNNIRDLFGHKVDLGLIKTNPICRLGP
uniref:Phenylalanyl-tRNA synthetase domain-containing protein n=1 Tax=Quercus lobata TaxID=97700 RepID=A0A7N2MYS6_QUELO